MHALILCENHEWRVTSDVPMRAVQAGLLALGHKATVLAPGVWPITDCVPDVVFVWNGFKGWRGQCVQQFGGMGVPVIIMERAFFDRHKYTQFDHAGFNHAASWGAHLHEPAPPEGKARLEAAWGVPRPITKRGGYLLALLQTVGDAQLRGVELAHPAVLAKAIDVAAPDMLIRLRAHPLFPWDVGKPTRCEMIRGTLADAVSGARFVVTCNSNAGNEALAMGCPVLAVGPSLYGIAGVARTATPATLEAELQTMADGWLPDEGARDNYLHWLASRQWSAAEIADGECLRGVLDAATA